MEKNQEYNPYVKVMRTTRYSKYGRVFVVQSGELYRWRKYQCEWWECFIIILNLVEAWVSFGKYYFCNYFYFGKR